MAIMDDLVARIRPVLDAIWEAGGWPLIVGGAVRDALLGIEAKDADVEAHGLRVKELAEALGRVGRVHLVGEAFGVLKVSLPHDGEIDVSVPRTENKIGRGHRSFAVDLTPLSPEEAATRRDFTINSLAYDPYSHEVIDPFGGVADLHARVLRHTSAAFVEDPLRILRGMQFAARFAMRLAPETAVLCRELLPEAGALAVERVWEEWRKWAEKGTVPSLGLQVLVDSGWIELYPELRAMLDCPQDTLWHPEGNVFVHTALVCDAAERIANRDGLVGEDRLVLTFAALCHDLGKPATTTHDADGHIRSAGHAEAGVPLAESFLHRIGCLDRVIKEVLPLIREHLVHVALPLEPRPIRRLALRLEPATIVQWGRLVEADHSARPPLPPESPAAEIVALAEALAADQGKPKAILMGRHLLARGMSPGPEMGQILRAAYEAQIAGAFDSLEGALAWLDEMGEHTQSAKL